MESKELLQKIKDYIDEKLDNMSDTKFIKKISITTTSINEVSSVITLSCDNNNYSDTSHLHNHYLEQKLQDLTGAIVHLQQTIQDQDARLRFLEQQVNGVPPYSAPPFYYTTGSGTSTI